MSSSKKSAKKVFLYLLRYSSIYTAKVESKENNMCEDQALVLKEATKSSFVKMRI